MCQAHIAVISAQKFYAIERLECLDLMTDRTNGDVQLFSRPCETAEATNALECPQRVHGRQRVWHGYSLV